MMFSNFTVVRNCVLLLSSFFPITCALGNNYDEKNDTTVVPIVLSIGGLIMLLCVIGCCNQGNLCCNKEKDKIPPELQGNSLGRPCVRRVERRIKKTENERAGCACRQNELPAQVTFMNETLPRYSSCKAVVQNGTRNGYSGRNGCHSKRSHSTHCH